MAEPLTDESGRKPEYPEKPLTTTFRKSHKRNPENSSPNKTLIRTLALVAGWESRRANHYTTRRPTGTYVRRMYVYMYVGLLLASPPSLSHSPQSFTSFPPSLTPPSPFLSIAIDKAVPFTQSASLMQTRSEYVLFVRCND